MFRGETAFLSNFCGAQVDVVLRDGRRHKAPTVEHAYQAVKALDFQDQLMIIRAQTPGQAKRLGRQVLIDPRWDEKKVGIMKSLVNQKFKDRHLAMKLAMLDGPIVEQNVWHDNFWGSCICPRCNDHGRNELGKILMEIREQIRRNEFVTV